MTFTSPLKDTKCEVDEEVTLTCEVSKPDQKVKWMKNGKVIKPDKKTKVTVDGKVHKLTIPKSALDDTAEYTAKIGDEATSGKLTVKGECRTNLGTSRCRTHCLLLVIIIYSFGGSPCKGLLYACDS